MAGCCQLSGRNRSSQLLPGKGLQRSKTPRGFQHFGCNKWTVFQQTASAERKEQREGGRERQGEAEERERIDMTRPNEEQWTRDCQTEQGRKLARKVTLSHLPLLSHCLPPPTHTLLFSLLTLGQHLSEHCLQRVKDGWRNLVSLKAQFLWRSLYCSGGP